MLYPDLVAGCVVSVPTHRARAAEDDLVNDALELESLEWNNNFLQVSTSPWNCGPLHLHQAHHLTLGGRATALDEKLPCTDKAAFLRLVTIKTLKTFSFLVKELKNTRIIKPFRSASSTILNKRGNDI